MKLGSELAKELGHAAEHDLLTNWMAHYLAEKLSLAKAARGASKKALSDECADLILKIWKHRHSLTDGTRPLGSFEAMFRALEELASDQPRNSLLRSHLPKVKASEEIDQMISFALDMDSAANSLIRYSLAAAVERIPSKDKRWAKLKAALAPLDWDIKIVVRMMDDAETLVDEKAELKEAQRQELERISNILDAFLVSATLVRKSVKKRLSSFR